MHSSFFLLLELTTSCSALAGRSAQLAEDPSTAVPQIITLPKNAESGFDRRGDDGVGTIDSGSDSREVLTLSQTDDNKQCFLNNKNQMPSKRRLRAREWCRNNEYSPKNPPATNTKLPATTPKEGEPKEGSADDGILNQPSGEQNRSPLPGPVPSSGKGDPNPCKEQRTFAVCSPFQPTKTWFPLSLIRGNGLLEYCRSCTFLLSPIFHLSLRRTQPSFHPKLELINQ